MPAPIESSIKRKVIQEWLTGESRSKIAIDSNIGEGTVSGIVSEFKIGLDAAEFDSARDLALAATKQGLNLSDLASHFRLYNYFRSSGASDEDIESFIARVSSIGDIPPENIIQCVNQLFNISNTESIPFDQVSSYVNKKLEEKQKIDEDIKAADSLLQSKNMSIQAINEHLQLNEKLKEHDLSTQDIDKFLNLVLNAKRYGFEPKKIVGKLRAIQRLEKKEKKLEHNCTILSNLLDKHKETVPLAQLIEAMNIGKNELVSFKIAVNEAIETYSFTPSAAALHVINVIQDYNKKGQLKRELSELNFQKYAINRFCSSRNQVLMALMNPRSHGITEDRILELNNFLENNGYKDMKSNI
jgi:hypothetical protein